MNDSVFLIISRRYSPGMSADDLYETTRKEWKLEGEIREQREHLQYALAVVRSEVKEVYKIYPGSWELVGDDRWKFSGEVASENIRSRCIGRRMTQPSYGRPVMHGNLEEFMAEHENPDNSMTKTAIELLRQFYQIIFHGPPGTGKTHCAKQLLPELLESPDSTPQQLQSDGRWDIVQFHPSYNYEDFVRGVQVETTQSGQVAYKTLNRTFGEMCDKANAKENQGKKYALIIDEINRANVSAVLGELIYALEYRGHPVNTPYDAGNGKALTIPENLYVIGTMNTADRTIGQIDYAVRRRFAFVACPPDERIIDKHPDADDDSLRYFHRVNAIFDKRISPDFDAADVRVGHSYFLAAGSKLGYKLVYQAVPILREYVKDGVLKKEAESEIQEIEDDARELLEGKSLAGELAESDSSANGKLYFHWRNGDRFGVAGVGRTALGIIKDFIEQHPDKDANALRTEFESIALGQHKRVILASQISPERRTQFFRHDPVDLNSGESVAISAEWGATGTSLPQWNAFKGKMESRDYGYSIGQCYLVNLGEGGKPGGESRSWESSFNHSFISARGRRYVSQIQSLNVGDFLFVKLVDTANNKNGVIACAEVVATAEPIEKFQTKEGPLANVVVDGGLTYAEKHPAAFEGGELREHVVGVRWIGEAKNREAAEGDKAMVKLSSEQYQRFPFFTDKIRREDFRNLRERFKLPGYDE